MLRTSGDRSNWGEGSGSASRKNEGRDDLHGTGSNVDRGIAMALTEENPSEGWDPACTNVEAKDRPLHNDGWTYVFT